MAFLAPGAPVPAELRTAEFLLRPLRASDVELDYDAVMSSRAALRSWSQSGWPAEDFPLAENLADLERHEREHLAGEAFTYTVLTPDATRCLGCVYVAPLRPEEEAALVSAAGALGPAGLAAGERRARVTFWARADEPARDLDRALFAALRAWFAAAWALDRLVFTAARGEARQPALFRAAGLAEAGECTLADGRCFLVFSASAAGA